VSLSAASLSVRQSALLGDRARRQHAAIRLIARWAPWVAGIACGASVVTLLAGVARPVGIVLLGVGVLAAAGLLVAARMRGLPADDAVAALDAAASLDGSLRSAYWFAGDTQRIPESAAEATWVAFHLDHAASRAEATDWRHVYTRPPSARRWLATAVLASAVIALLRVESPRPTQAVASAPDDPADTLIVIPPHLVGEVVQGMKAMQAGKTPSKETLTAVGQALEIAKQDPRARRELAALLAQAGGDFFGSWGDEWGRNDMDEGTPPPEWAYEEAVSRASVQPEANAGGPDAATPAGDTRGAAKTGEVNRGVPATPRPDTAFVRADTSGQPGSFASLLFGRAQAKGDAAGPSPRASAPTAGVALTAALRREVVHARSDVGDANRVAAERRAADRGRPPVMIAGVAPTGMRYDAADAGRPPAIPDARRGLVHDFFARPAGRGPAPSQP